MGVLLVDFCDYLERSVGFAEDLKDFFTVVVDSRFLLYLHAIVCPFGAFYVEVDLAILFGAFYNGSSLRAFLTADNAPDVEL